MLHARPTTALLALLATTALPLCYSSARAPLPADDELESIQTELEASPDDPELLERAGLAHIAAGDSDLGLWYLVLAREQSGSDAKLAARLKAKLDELGPEGGVGDEVLEAYAEDLFKLAKTCEGKKLYANAVDLLSLCRGTRFEERAGERLEKLFQKEKAVTALLASGIDVPVQAELRLGPEEIARADAKHESWDDAYELKGKFYTVKTNMGYEMAHAIAGAMEQMNLFYRSVFGYKERGGGMRRCVLNVYKTRAEFDKYTESSPTVKGFFRPGENSVTTYDPRTEERGGTIDGLWSTLFHEASHQFTRAVWPNDIPTWLNEGTASYFEGARLLPNGAVAFNGIPERRLRGVLYSIDKGSPTVSDVVTHFEAGSYDGSYYPFGWALVYFCRNYEDDKSERIYLPIYQAFMETYKGGGKHDVMERFEEYFVEKAGVEGIESFDAFVEFWASWIKALGKIHFGGAEQADVLIARGDLQTSNEKYEQAVASYRWALEKRAGDARALVGLASALAELEQDDAAMYSYRKLLALTRALADPEQPLDGIPDRSSGDIATEAMAGVEAINRNVAETLTSADASFVSASVSASQRIADAGFARTALHLLQTSQAVMGGDGKLAALAVDLGGDEIDLRRWRRPVLDTELTHWIGGDEWRSADGGIQFRTDGGLQSCTYRDNPPERYRFEARVHPGEGGGDLPIFGLAYGDSEGGGATYYAVIPKTGTVGLIAFKDGQPELQAPLGGGLERDVEELFLAIEMFPDRVEFYLDDKRIGVREAPPSELRGRVGLVGQSCEVLFSDLRLKY